MGVCTPKYALFRARACKGYRVVFLARELRTRKTRFIAGFLRNFRNRCGSCLRFASPPLLVVVRPKRADANFREYLLGVIRMWSFIGL
jgi:hypothetical protein